MQQKIYDEEGFYLKAYEIASAIEKFAPINIAMPWDNVGFLIGDKNKEITKVLLTLDVTLEVAQQAVVSGCDMIISHHPMFFKGIKTIDYSTTEGKLVKKLIVNDITVYVCHTNMDCASGGINDRLAELFELKNITVLDDSSGDSDIGIGRIGNLSNPCSVSELCKKIKNVLKTPFVRVSYGTSEIVKTLAVVSGSGSEYISQAVRKKADAIITGDMKYHDSLDASDLGITVIDAGHYPTEIVIMDILSEALSECGVEIICAKSEDVYKVI